MNRTTIHPGVHLAEELNELDMSAAELARQIDVPVNRITAILNGQLNHRRYCFAPGPLVRHEPGILAQPADVV